MNKAQNEKQIQEQQKKKFSIFKLYEELTIAAKMRKSNRSSFCINAPSVANSLAIDFMSMVSDNTITYMYYINAMPRRIPINFKTQLRAVCDKETRINFINLMDPHKVDMNSTQMKAKLRVLETVGQENDARDVNSYNIHTNIASIERQKWVEDTLDYIADAVQTRGCSTLKSTTIVQITGVRGPLFDNSVKKVEDCAKRMGIELERVVYEIPEVLKATSPFIHTKTDVVEKNKPVNVFTDEIMARFVTYSPGVTGKTGFYFGTDIHTNSPIFKEVKHTSEDAEVWLITAQTGGGKSFFTKFILLQLIASGCNCTILDVEGTEYLPMARFLSHNSKVLVVNLGEGTGRYFDPVAIAPPLHIADIDAESYKMSLNYTTSTLKVLLGRRYEESTWFETVINDVVNLTYKQAGVTEDPNTWSKSTNLTLHTVFNNLQQLIGTQNNVDYDKAVKVAITTLKTYLHPTGLRAGLFKNRISIGEVADADLVICSFGMAGRDASTVDETQMNLMQLGAAQFSHQRSIFSKAKKKYNVKVWEEVQRWGAFKGSVGVLKTAITGGRKLGDISIVITNDIASLLDDDPYSLIQNSTDRFIGKINSKPLILRICEEFAISELQYDLDMIANGNNTKIAGDGDARLESIYNHAFLCLMQNGDKAVSKMVVPKEIAQATIFRTGI